MKKLKLVSRIIWTVIVMGVEFVLVSLLKNAGDVAAAQAAPGQLLNDNAYFIVSRGIAVRGWLDTAVFLIAIVALLVIWVPMFVNLFKSAMKGTN